MMPWVPGKSYWQIHATRICTHERMTDNSQLTSHENTLTPKASSEPPEVPGPLSENSQTSGADWGERTPSPLRASIHSFTCSFRPQLFPRHPVCASNCSVRWEFRREQNKSLTPCSSQGRQNAQSGCVTRHLHMGDVVSLGSLIQPAQDLLI